jgi:hypothetical protein
MDGKRKMAIEHIPAFAIFRLDVFTWGNAREVAPSSSFSAEKAAASPQWRLRAPRASGKWWRDLLETALSLLPAGGCCSRGRLGRREH